MGVNRDVFAEMQKTVTAVGEKIVYEYWTNQYNDIPQKVLDNKEKYHFKEKIISTKKIETTAKEIAEKQSSYVIERNEPYGKSMTSIPEGKAGIDYIELEDKVLLDWDDMFITTIPERGVHYVEKGSQEDNEGALARKWKESAGARTDVSEEQLQTDLEAGYLVEDSTGKIITSINELTPSISEKVIRPYDFDEGGPNGSDSDFPQDYTRLSLDDVAVGRHVKAAFEYLPLEVKHDPRLYTKEAIYIQDLYDVFGGLNTPKLIGQEKVDWNYDYILDTNGAKLLVTSANLHELGNPLSVAEANGGIVDDRKVYEYWEKRGNVYVKTNWSYVITSPNYVEFHEHELNTSQDGYNFGAGTISTWYVLNQPGNLTGFQQQVAQKAASGSGNSGIANGWANGFGFKEVLDTSNPLTSILGSSVIGPGLYRTTSQQYGMLYTPSAEIIDDMIFMEVYPYNDINGNKMYDAAGQPVYQWRKYYYTDKQEYYALERITAYDYGYQVSLKNSYTYDISQVYYQTRKRVSQYQKQRPVYSYEVTQKEYSWSEEIDKTTSTSDSFDEPKNNSSYANTPKVNKESQKGNKYLRKGLPDLGNKTDNKILCFGLVLVNVLLGKALRKYRSFN
ncbi:hypothetical protein RV18_GL002515 [Enterococcus termitis]|nr:hypothetical protein RV18_GL002515 [Enterococcus termitis]